MATPGLRLEDVFKQVRVDVQQESNNKQVPWDSSSVTGDFDNVMKSYKTSKAELQDVEGLVGGKGVTKMKLPTKKKSTTNKIKSK